jgi:hypothetical protein
LLRGRVDLPGDLWLEVDKEKSEECFMDQKERDRLLMFRDAIEDAGVTRQAREDALRRIETHFAGQEPDSIDVRSYVDGPLKRQARHLWPEDRARLSGAPVPGGAEREPSARERRKGEDVPLPAEQRAAIEKIENPTRRLTAWREAQTAERTRRGQP